MVIILISYTKSRLLTRSCFYIFLAHRAFIYKCLLITSILLAILTYKQPELFKIPIKFKVVFRQEKYLWFLYSKIASVFVSSKNLSKTQWIGFGIVRNEAEITKVKLDFFKKKNHKDIFRTQNYDIKQQSLWHRSEALIGHLIEFVWFLWHNFFDRCYNSEPKIFCM